MASTNTRPRLETDRLILRVPSLDDLDRWAEMMADENAARFIGGVAPKPIVWRMIMQMVGAWELTGIVRSRRVAERLGATLRGEARMPPPMDHELVDVWGHTRGEWRANPRFER